MPTRYFAEASSVGFRRSVVYGLSTLEVVGRYLLHRLRLKPSRQLLRAAATTRPNHEPPAMPGARVVGSGEPYGAGAGFARSLILVEAVLVGRLLADDKAVLVGRRGIVQRGQTLRLERGAERDGRCLRIVGRLAGAAVDELEGGGRVLGEHIDLTRLEGREDDLAVAELELAFHGRAVALEHLGEDLAEDLLLVEVGRADGDVAGQPRR